MVSAAMVAAVAKASRAHGTRAMLRARTASRRMVRSFAEETTPGAKMTPEGAIPPEVKMILEGSSKEALKGYLTLKVIEVEITLKVNIALFCGFTTVAVAAFMNQSSNINLLEVKMQAQEEKQKATDMEATRMQWKLYQLGEKVQYPKNAPSVALAEEEAGEATGSAPGDEAAQESTCSPWGFSAWKRWWQGA